MRHRQIITKTGLALGAGALILGLAACDDPVQAVEEKPEESFFGEPKQTVERVHRNQLGDEPSDFLRRRASDPIRWQGWSPQVFEDAKTEQRLVFALIGSGRNPDSIRLLDKLRERPGIIDNLHEFYVCCLADLEVNPELGPMMTTLAVELKRPISFPAMIWLSHEGNPVAWLPLRPNDIDDFEEVFGNANAMVTRIWRDSPGYVVRNSRRDNERRQAGSLPPAPAEDEPPTPDLKTSFQTAVRQLTSLYDPASHTIDGSGGLIPSGLLNLSALVALAPGTSGQQSQRASDLLDGTCDLLQRGAIRDPLDGGFFTARRARGWELPVFIKAADTQSQIAQAYARASILLKSPRYLEASRGALAYADRRFGEGGEGLGLFELVPSRPLEPRVFLWSQERLREVLNGNEFKVATAAFLTSNIGNIPPESDPKRDFFRKNSLGMKKFPAEIAASIGISEEEARATFEAVRQRLFAQREELLSRVDGTQLEPTRVTETNARFASALACLSLVSGDLAQRDQAKAVMDFLKAQHYSENSGLLRIAATNGHRQVKARGADYAAVLNALFDLYRLDLDPAHLSWARVLADELLKTHLTVEGHLLEAPVAEQLGLLEIYSTSMIFGDSTWGTVYGPLERLHQLTGTESYRQTADSLRENLLLFLSKSKNRDAMIHTDFLANAMIPLAGTVVYLTGDPAAPDFAALHELLRQPAYRAVTILHLGTALPEGFKAPVPASPSTSAHVFVRGEQAGQAGSPADLDHLLRNVLSGG